MDHWEELQRLQHQLELANRALSFISDQATVNRLAMFGKEIRDKLDELQAASLREEIRRRAFEFWQEADRPEGRHIECWRRAESEQPGGLMSCERLGRTRGQCPRTCLQGPGWIRVSGGYWLRHGAVMPRQKTAFASEERKRRAVAKQLMAAQISRKRCICLIR
jgi:hypothetical protein